MSAHYLQQQPWSTNLLHYPAKHLRSTTLAPRAQSELWLLHQEQEKETIACGKNSHLKPVTWRKTWANTCKLPPEMYLLSAGSSRNSQLVKWQGEQLDHCPPDQILQYHIAPLEWICFTHTFCYLTLCDPGWVLIEPLACVSHFLLLYCCDGNHLRAVLLSEVVGTCKRKYVLLAASLNRSQNHYIWPLTVCHILAVNGEWVLSSTGSPRPPLVSQSSFLFQSQYVGLCRTYSLTSIVLWASSGNIAQKLVLLKVCDFQIGIFFKNMLWYRYCLNWHQIATLFIMFNFKKSSQIGLQPQIIGNITHQLFSWSTYYSSVMLFLNNTFD